MEFLMEKENFITPMAHTMLAISIKAMLMVKADLSVPKVGFMRGNSKTSRQKGRVYFIIEI